jgi:hypothetical protein
MIKCEWFKLYLSPETLRSRVPDPRLPPLPVGKEATDVIADFLNCLWKYAKGQITESIGSVADLGEFPFPLPLEIGTDEDDRRGGCVVDCSCGMGRCGVCDDEVCGDSSGSRSEFSRRRHPLAREVAYHHVRPSSLLLLVLLIRYVSQRT